MTYSQTIIIDGTIPANNTLGSSLFYGGEFLSFDIPSLSADESVQLGCSIGIIVPIIGRGNTFKYIPFKISEAFVTGSADTDEVIVIPRELNESGFPVQVYVGSSVSTDIRVYLYSTNYGKQDVQDDLDYLRNAVDALATSQALLNAATTTLYTGLSVVTSGVSATAIPLVTQSTATLSPYIKTTIPAITP